MKIVKKYLKNPCKKTKDVAADARAILYVAADARAILYVAADARAVLYAAADASYVSMQL